jgi:uncharacterized protein (DUF305 family)
MKDKGIIYGIVGLMLGAITTGAIMNMSKGSTMNGESSMTMEEMRKNLEGKSGDAFDKAFISNMIQHHHGAIDMANEAQKNAKHSELKSMANDIIIAQEKEIAQMQDWQKQWGY